MSLETSATRRCTPQQRRAFVEEQSDAALGPGQPGGAETSSCPTKAAAPAATDDSNRGVSDPENERERVVYGVHDHGISSPTLLVRSRCAWRRRPEDLAANHLQSRGDGASSASCSRMIRISSRSSASAAMAETSSRIDDRTLRRAAASRSAVRTASESLIPPGQRDLVIRKPRNLARTVCLVRHLDAIPPELHEQFLDGVMERLGAGRRRPARARLREAQHGRRLPDASR